MTTTVKNIISSKQIEATQTTQYTSTGGKAIIDSFVAVNVSAARKSFSVNIVTSGGTPSASNLFIDDKELSSGESYTCPELVGQYLESGDYVSAIADDATSITIRASGREIV